MDSTPYTRVIEFSITWQNYQSKVCNAYFCKVNNGSVGEQSQYSKYTAFEILSFECPFYLKYDDSNIQN